MKMCNYIISIKTCNATSKPALDKTKIPVKPPKKVNKSKKPKSK